MSDGNLLLLSRTQFAEKAMRGNVQFEPGQLFVRPVVKLAPMDSAPPRSRPALAQQHVFSNGEMAKVCKFLVDRRNAGFQRDARRTELCFTFLPNDLAAVRRINAAEDFNESGFAGAIF